MLRIISKQGSYLKVSEDLLNLSSSWNALLKSGMQETIKKEIETDLTNNDLEELIYLMQLIIDQQIEELDKSLQKESLINLYQLRMVTDKYLINELSNRIDKVILSKLKPKDYDQKIYQEKLKKQPVFIVKYGFEDETELSDQYFTYKEALDDVIKFHTQSWAVILGGETFEDLYGSSTYPMNENIETQLLNEGLWNRTGPIPENTINTILEILNQAMYQKYGDPKINGPELGQRLIHNFNFLDRIYIYVIYPDF